MGLWDAVTSATSAASSLVGNWMTGEREKDNQKAQLALAQQEYEKQKEFAQSGIQWKARDALAAGIHPLAAIGAPTSSYSAQTFSLGTSGLGSGLSAAGQDIGRAVNATMSSKDRESAASKAAEALTLERGQLENDLLRTQIASQSAKLTQAGGTPAMPSLSDKKLLDGQANSGDLPISLAKKPKDRPKLFMGGDVVQTDPKTSNAEEYEDRYGDEGPVSWLPPIGIAWNDFKHNVGSGNLTREKFTDWFVRQLKWIDRSTDLGMGKYGPKGR